MFEWSENNSNQIIEVAKWQKFRFITEIRPQKTINSSLKIDMCA